MKVTVIGAGYVGLVTAACFAKIGHQVMLNEKRDDRLSMLAKGRSPIYEPGLDEILSECIGNGTIQFTADVAKAVGFSDIIFMCVGTPQDENGKADLSQIEEASRNIAKSMTGYKLIVEKSTVPVNTHRWVKKTVNRYADRTVTFDVASNPEFLREGCAIGDFMEPDRIVVGVETDRARALFSELYAYFTERDFPLLMTSPGNAELIKHAANSFLALKISYINMISDLCERVGADIEVVADGVGLDKRIGRNFLNAGIGYGGSCFPKDVKAFIKIAEDHGVNFDLLRETENINDRRRTLFLEKIENVLWINKAKTIAVWGLAFKPDTDDVREAPAITILQKLHESGAQLNLHDPQGAENFKRYCPEGPMIRYVSDKMDALKDADALLILTEWRTYRDADLAQMKAMLRLPIVIDGRNIFDVQQMKAQGFEYYSIGR